MSRYLTSRRLFLLLTGVILLVVVAGLTLGLKGRTATIPEKVVMDVQSTVSGWIYRPLSKLTGFFAEVSNLHQMYAENAELKGEVQDYESLRAQLKTTQDQNTTLRNMLGYKQSPKNKWQLVPAQVTGRDPSDWDNDMTINVGIADGVKPNMAIVAPDGSLVGRIAVASEFSSKVVLVTDTELGDGVSAVVQDDKEPFGVVTGSTQKQGNLEMTFWSSSVHVKDGDLVVTSNFSDIYPPDLVIGRVNEVQTGAQANAESAVITPSADLDYLENVFVVTNYHGANAR